MQLLLDLALALAMRRSQQLDLELYSNPFDLDSDGKLRQTVKANYYNNKLITQSQDRWTLLEADETARESIPWLCVRQAWG